MEAEGGDDRVRRTHDDQHDGEGAMSTLSLSLCVCVCCTLFSSLSYKGKMMSSYAEGPTFDGHYLTFLTVNFSGIN